MDPKLLTQLAIVVDLGSVTKAARTLNVTQPTLSRTISVIEDRVGGRVLRRGRYGVTPTEIGARLAEEGREILRRSKQAQTAIQQWRHGLVGDLRVGMGPMLAAGIMGDFACELVANPTSYSLKLTTDVPSTLLQSLMADTVDVAILPYDLNRSEAGLHREKLFDDRLSVFVGRDDPLAHATSVPASALSGHHWITVGETAGLYDVTRSTLDSLGLADVTPTLENSGDVTITFRLLEKTRACTVLPFKQGQRLAEQYPIAPVTLDADLSTRPVGFWTTLAGRERPQTLDFHKRLRAHLARIGFVG